MSAMDAASYAVHLVFAGLWTGSVLFVAYAVLPLARDGELNAAPLEGIAGKLTTVSRASAVLLLLTGGHLAATRGYGVDALTGTLSGYAVVAMVVLWFVLAALVEMGAGKLTDGTERDKVREPATEARPLFLGASAVAVLLLANAGVLVALGLGLL